MPKFLRKDRKFETNKSIDYDQVVSDFIQSSKPAFIPSQQLDTNRFHWHSAGEKQELATKTLKLWKNISLCGRHKHPIVGLKSDTDPYDRSYDSDYECDYECNDSDSEYECLSNCCYLDEHVMHKMRTVVIFNKETSQRITNMDSIQIKDFLVEIGIVTKEDKEARYHI